MSLLFLIVSPDAQKLSTDVYLTDEELLEALSLGDISYSEYLILKEIISQGIDSTNIHLFDFIPNLAAFLKDKKALQTDLEQEQQQPFKQNESIRKTTIGEWKHLYYQEITDRKRNWYRSSMRIKLNNNLRADFQIEREYYGREQITRRSLQYININPHALIRELRVGNFTKRLGLGTIYGYRGRLLATSARLDNESLLFPDYGGANGAFIRVQAGKSLTVQSLVSVYRDGDHHLSSTAIMLTWKNNNWQLSATGGANRLTDRNTGSHQDDTKIGGTGQYSYRNGYVAIETSFQTAARSGFGAIVMEGRHRYTMADIRYAGWIYDDDYIDLTAGSKAGNFRHKDSLSEVAFDYSTRRTGTRGGLLKTVVQLLPDLEFVNSLIYSSVDRNNYNIQLLTGLVKQLNPHWSLRIDLLDTSKKKAGPTNLTETTDCRTRFELRFKTGALLMRSYIGYRIKTDQKDYWPLFFRIRYNSESFGRVELWSNLARFDIKRSYIDYWYIFIRNERQLWSNLFTGFKLTHRYNQHTSIRHTTTIGLEVTAKI